LESIQTHRDLCRRRAVRQQGFETPADLDEIEGLVRIGSGARAAGPPLRFVVEQRLDGGDETARIVGSGDDSRTRLRDDLRGQIGLRGGRMLRRAPNLAARRSDERAVSSTSEFSTN